MLEYYKLSLIQTAVLRGSKHDGNSKVYLPGSHEPWRRDEYHSR